MIYFRDRIEAGQKLAEKLLVYQSGHPLILALPRGGIVIGYEVAKKLGTKLDVLISRKIGAPADPELALGAISEDNAEYFDENLIKTLNVSREQLSEIVNRERKELEIRRQKFRGGNPLPDLNNKTVIIVDDGIATGATAIAAVRAALKKSPRRLILAIPACPSQTLKTLQNEGAEVICLETADTVGSVGESYEDFAQVSDEEVVRMLREVNKFLTWSQSF